MIKKIILKCYIYCNQVIEETINEILHQQVFQRLEASFLGLTHIINTADYYADHLIKIKILTVHFNELKKQLLRDKSIEDSLLFEKLYHQEYNHPGGEPYSLWINDYLMDINENNHLYCLEKLADMAALAFVPMITALKDYKQDRPFLKNYLWKKLIKKMSADFMGLFYPPVLMRRTYDLEKIKHIDDYLWGNPCYDYAAKAISVFAETGWFTELTSKNFTSDISNTRYNRFSIDSCEFINRKNLVKLYFTPKEMTLLNEAGLTIVSESDWKKNIIFTTSPSIKEKTKKSYSTSLPVLLCVVRLIHCVKIMFRNKIGCFTKIEHYENYLQHWLLSYCSKYLPVSHASQARYPLAYAKITLNKSKNNHTHYPFIIELIPYLHHSNTNRVYIKSMFIIRE